MEDQSLRDLLGRLHEELEHGPPIDDRTRSLLGTVLADINVALESTRTGEPREHHSLVERLREGSGHLEESHPRLTATIGQLVDALTSIFK